jgi:beta-alanine--pyruvate transaminase
MESAAMQYTANTLENHWMPFTSNRDFKADPRLMVKAKGMHYWNHHGDKLIDASSGLFCCAAGHGRTEITEAVHAAMKEIDYTPHFQLGHPASFELARKVAKITPGDLDYVFFCNSGSEAVDTALKIAMAYHTAKGEGQRTRFVSRERAYHGVNIGGVSLSGMVRNREAFGAVMPGVAHMRHTWMPENRFVRGQPDQGAELADDLQRCVDLCGPKTIAACFVEPIAGSTGVLVPPKGYLERLRQICDRHGILLVFDEVICGFGRTGKAFGAQSFGVLPDMITMAKALTNGALPMGAVAVSEKIYHTVTSAALDGAVEFFHGYTYSAHPAACAAGIAALDIYEREGLFERAAEMSDYFLDRMFDLKGIKAVTDIRGFGMLAGIDLAPAERPGLRGYDVTKRLFKRGLHIKFTGDSGICAPALVAERRDIDEICAIFREVFSEY